MFFAPEMFNRCYGMEADVWSVGIMMYRFISGRFPWFDAEPGKVAPGQIMNAVLSEPIPLDTPTWRYKSDACRDLVRRLLQRDPQKRIPITDALQHPWLRMHCGDDEDEPCVVVHDDEEEEAEELEHIPRSVVMSNVVSLYSKQTAAQDAKRAAAAAAATSPSSPS
jgi:serine/threonine protein kinase